MKFLEAVNPVTLFVAAVIFSLPMLTTIDLVSASVALVVWLSLFLASGVSLRTIARRSWPLFIAAPLSGISMLLYAAPGGQVYATLGFAVISDASISLATAVTLRVLALGVPTLTALAGIDPTKLADGLGQVARLPPRFVLASLAGVRLFGVLQEDWQQISLARRARGLGETGRIRRALQAAFALLVVALRRGGTLATAMEARGFGGDNRLKRTWARPSTLSRVDLWAVLIAGGVAALAVGAAVASGAFRPPWVSI